jgi:HAD superfamily hydrolase (TIGR01509 family)
MTAIRGVILDVDGTLVDSNDAHAHAWVEALAEHGRAVPFDRVRRLIGMGGDKLLPEVTDLREDTPEGEAIGERRSKIFKEKYLPKLRAFPGVIDLLKLLQGRGLKLVVASSAQEDELDSLLDIAGAKPFLEEVTSSSDAENSKPDPDIVEQAARQLKLPAESLVMIGDTPYDVQAAEKTGIPTIAFRCGGWGDRDLAGAVAIYDGPEELVREFDRSPLGSLVS